MCVAREAWDAQSASGTYLGADPEACIESVFTNADVIVAGNHDREAVGLEDLAYMNDMVAEAIPLDKRSARRSVRRTPLKASRARSSV